MLEALADDGAAVRSSRCVARELSDEQVGLSRDVFDPARVQASAPCSHWPIIAAGDVDQIGEGFAGGAALFVRASWGEDTAGFYLASPG